jgi:hypothetical protein
MIVVIFLEVALLTVTAPLLGEQGNVPSPGESGKAAGWAICPVLHWRGLLLSLFHWQF